MRGTCFRAGTGFAFTNEGTLTSVMLFSTHHGLQDAFQQKILLWVWLPCTRQLLASRDVGHS